MGKPRLAEFSGSIKKVLLDRGPHFMEWLGIDENDPNKAVHWREYDATEAPNMQKGMQDYRVNLKSAMRRVANIPDFVLERALREKWDSDDWKKWVNDPVNRPWREYGCWKGRI